MPDDESIFTDQEVSALIMAYLNGEDPEPVEQTQLEELVNWAREVRINGAILHNLLHGKIVVRRGKDGDWVYTTTPGTEPGTSEHKGF